MVSYRSNRQHLTIRVTGVAFVIPAAGPDLRVPRFLLSTRRIKGFRPRFVWYAFGTFSSAIILSTLRVRYHQVFGINKHVSLVRIGRGRHRVPLTLWVVALSNPGLALGNRFDTTCID